MRYLPIYKSRLRSLGRLAGALVWLSGASGILPLRGQSLYLLTSTPTPQEARTFPASLSRLESNGAISPIRELVPKNIGVDGVEINFEGRLITVASPPISPHSFQVIRMDAPERSEFYAVNYWGSNMSSHLLDVPGRGIVQSVEIAQHPSQNPNLSVKPLEFTEETMRSIGHKLMGVDLGTGLEGTDRDLPFSDYKYLSLAGRAVGIWPPMTTATSAASDGRSLLIPAVGGSLPLNIQLPPSARLTPAELVVYHVINRSIVVVSLSGGKFDGSSETTLRIYDRMRGSWSEFPVPGERDIVRGFGSWVAVAVAENNAGNPDRISPGRRNRRSEEAPTGDPPDERFGLLREYFPGQLYLYNAITRQRYHIDTGEGDSEVLLVSDGTVFYRVNDQLYRADLDGASLLNTTLLATNDLIRDTHWAFLSR